MKAQPATEEQRLTQDRKITETISAIITVSVDTSTNDASIPALVS